LLFLQLTVVLLDRYQNVLKDFNMIKMIINAMYAQKDLLEEVDNIVFLDMMKICENKKRN
jgi:hypothetical protein